MRKRVLTTAIAAAALALAACSGDGTGPGSGDGLTPAELAQLNRAILGLSAGVRAQAGGSFSTSPATEDGSGSLTFDFDETAPCQPGGSVGVAGTMSLTWDDAARTSGLSADFGVAHDDCDVRLEHGGIVTISGDPDIDVLLDAAAGPSGLTAFRISETGAFTWARGAGNHGRCTLDVVAELNPATGLVHVSGDFCGMDVSGTFQGG